MAWYVVYNESGGKCWSQSPDEPPANRLPPGHAVKTYPDRPRGKVWDPATLDYVDRPPPRTDLQRIDRLQMWRDHPLITGMTLLPRQQADIETAILEVFGSFRDVMTLEDT